MCQVHSTASINPSLGHPPLATKLALMALSGDEFAPASHQLLPKGSSAVLVGIFPKRNDFSLIPDPCHKLLSLWEVGTGCQHQGSAVPAIQPSRGVLLPAGLKQRLSSFIQIYRRTCSVLKTNCCKNNNKKM